VSESLLNFLNSDAFIGLIMSVLVTGWGLFKSSDWWKAHVDKRREKAIDCLEAGVDTSYRSYVQAIKHARDDGKLTPEEMAEAREIAITAAIDYGREKGVDVVKELGPEIHVMIAWIVKALKGKGGAV
jgi:hypothetical protein